MEHESGDDYIRRTASFIRENEPKLAESGLGRRRKAVSTPNVSVFNPLGWVGLADGRAPITPVIFSLDTHHLFYLLMRLEALGIDVGSLDVEIESPSRPLSYIHVRANDKSDTISIAESFVSSLSAISKLSLGSSWWGNAEPRSVEAELKYVYSAFTKLPALSLRAPGPKVVAELAQDPPANSVIPLDAFKNLQSLECLDIDPRALMGWDKLAESLRSLTIKRSGMDDLTCVFLDAVVDDQLRREGDVTRSRIRKLNHRESRGFHSSLLPETVREDDAEEHEANEDHASPPSVLASKLSPLKWAFLKHLSLADNALTGISSSLLTPLTSLTHLDLSSNLLVSIPSFSTLYNLVSLNLSDNMIDSVLGIYAKLGQVLTLNLAHNRLDSLCGLERLMALERVDIRNNILEESAEVGRLSVLPNIAEVWIDGNPFVQLEENYRVRCFDHFWKEGKTILLDGSLPSFYERRSLTTLPPEQMYSTRTPAPFAPSESTRGVPSAAAIVGTQSPVVSPELSGSSSAGPSPSLAAVIGKPKKRRNKRIVALDGGESDNRSSEDGGRSILQSRIVPDVRQARSKSPPEKPASRETNSQQPDKASEAVLKIPDEPIRRSRHSRYHTEYAPPSPSAEFLPSGLDPTNLTSKSGTYSASAKRRNRISASLYEPSRSNIDGDDINGNSSTKQIKEAGAFRAKIEALRAEMGDNWLQVLSQSQLRSDHTTKR